MEKLDRLVADHIEHRLLQSDRLEKILSSVLNRREERTERQATHIAELRKRATEADAKLKRLYDAIENGVTDLSDLMLKDRIAELKAIRDQARADTERAEGAIERLGPTITAQSIKAFARTARKRMRIESYRRDYLRALAQRVEVDAKELRIMGSKSELLRTLVAASSAKTAGFGVPSSEKTGAPRPMKMGTTRSRWRYEQIPGDTRRRPAARQSRRTHYAFLVPSRHPEFEFNPRRYTFVLLISNPIFR
jgi:site-specific DNA recombinase